MTISMTKAQMFPPKTLSGELLKDCVGEKGRVAVTIEKVDFEMFKKDGEEEISYLVKFKEIDKPMRLNKTNAGVLFDTCGEDCAEWIGQVVQIYPIEIEVPTDDGGMRDVWTVRVDIQRPRTAPPWAANTNLVELSRQSRQRLTAAAAASAKANGGELPAAQPRFGIDRALKIASVLHTRGERTIEWLTAEIAKDPAAATLIYGKALHEWPTLLEKQISTLIRSFPATAPELSEQALAKLRASWEPPSNAIVIDPKTGEVLNSDGAVLDSDDIPF